MFKKIILCFCFISCFSYASEQAAAKTSAVAVPPAVLPDISPKAFSVSGGEPYVRALHDFAQALLMQHRWLKAVVDNVAVEANIYGSQMRSGINILNLSAWLSQSANGCYIFAPEPNFFEKLQEINLAIKSGKDHELLIKTPRGDFVFAATTDGIALLLKHRTLFMADTIDQKYKPIIDKLYSQAIHQENYEVILLASSLKSRFERSQLNVARQQQTEQLKICGMDASGSRGVFDLPCYTLSVPLRQRLEAALCLIKMSNAAFTRGLVPGKNFCTEYNRVQPALYASVRKKLREQSLHMATRDRKFSAYAKTAKDEYFPENLDPIEDSYSQTVKFSQALDVVQQAVPVQEVFKIKQKISKSPKEKSKKPVQKSKKHKALHDRTTPPVCSQSIQEQAGLPAPSASSALPVQTDVPVVQEEHPEVNPGTGFCDKQDTAPAEYPAEVSPRPNTSAMRECHEAKDVAPVAVEASVHPEVPNLIDIPYSDGNVLQADEDARVVIDDPCNKMRLFLYQTDECERIDYKPFYKKNVKKWFESARAALSEQGYLNPSSEKYASTADKQFEKVRIHRFSRMVDRFIPNMGVRSSIPSRKPGHPDEIAITIPGYVEFLDTGTKKSCLFVYYVDSTNWKCFHRNMQFKDALKVCAEFCKKRFFDLEFPPLYMQKH
jgi:hypothetical protein